MKSITEPPSGRARLLAFDGGGIRGLFALQYAKRIETLLRARTGNPHLVLADHFHYIGGTSTGAIIAAFLSWGLEVAEIERLYRINALAMFQKSGWTTRFTSHKFVADGLTEFLQKFFVEDDGTPATFGTQKLKTLLLVVTRNASTGSPWPLSNNPQAKYNDPASPGNNLQIPLWQLVRASTAAPTFFPPEILRVKGEKGEDMEFAFEDGGITPFNNPAYLLKIMATLPEYNLGWKSGRERMSVVSIGTGGTKLGRDQHMLDVLSQAKNLPSALIGSFQQYQDLLCRVHGECRYGPPIDGELGALTRPSENPEYIYARYDKIFTDADLKAAEAVTKHGFTLDNLELMDFLCECGASHAEDVVKLEHFDDE
ncbi:patatin-like phospholipase family protein [Luteolibacter algae]|uniref:Patatin-like phospholipase family protein n=1 Tax=Luteolibacter algae TaxID=454151 RepID=A0ABW5D7G6_9BACT